MTELTERLDQFESRLRSMESDLYELRRLARESRAATAPAPVFAPAPPPTRRESTPTALGLGDAAPARLPVAQPSRVSEQTPAKEARQPFDLAALLGARALAWTGGSVTLLGIVFFFVLASERGWIGHGARVVLGAIASGALVGAGVWLRRKHGDTYASVSAVGAGLAGFYATLLAAAALYHLVASPVALGAAAAIAALGGAVAIAWRSESLASMGLVGAMLVPIPIALQADHQSALGTAFAGLVLTAATVVAGRFNWRGLLVASVVATAPQVLALVIDHHAYATGLAAGFWLLYGGGALWLTLRTRLSYLPVWLVAFSAAFGGWSAAWLFHGREQGIALLVVAGAYAAVSGGLWLRDRDTASVLWAISLTVAAVGAA